MAKKMTKERALLILGNVDEDKVFYVKDGQILRNLYDLKGALSNMSNEQYSFHRNNERNDFYNWVLYVIKDLKLANDIARAKTQKTTEKKVQTRIETLEKV